MTVLLGKVPPYQAQTPSSGLPALPIENKHPYHIVVVAGQECPTPSGVPRGLGGGLLKGVVAKKDDKDREKDKDKKGHPEDMLASLDKAHGSPSVLAGERVEHPWSDSDSESDENMAHDASSRPTTPTPHPHSPVHHRNATKTKGWSTLLDGKRLPCPSLRRD